ncbi:MAG: hypothetical protein O7E57_03995 [Gammaproteobacteria bacterium]|nr:hypothetical protein [Gammaproteobacteria bacterium]
MNRRLLKLIVITPFTMGIITGGITGCAKPSSPDNPAATAQEVAEVTHVLPNARVIARGANISGANGIHFGPDGLLYVASVIGSELIALDPADGEIKHRWGSDQGVQGPDDVAFNASGDYFWTSILTGEVAGFTADGERVVAAKLGPGVNPITFSNDGRLFVAQCFFDTGLYEIDPKGVKEPRLISGDLGPGCGLNGMDWGPDDRLYGPRWFQGSVVSFDVDSGEMREEVTGLQVPAAVKFNSKGHLHVLDTAAGKVHRVVDGELVTIANLTPGLDNFAFDADDVLFVSSFTDGFVARVENDTLIELAPGGMAHPGGVAVHNGQVVVADFHSIRAYTPDTGDPIFVQRNILGVSEIGSIVSIADDGDNLILTSWMDGNVRIWDPANEKTLARFDGLAAPVHAVRFGSAIAVTLHGNRTLVLIDADGTISELAAGFTAPTGLAVLGDDLLVTDRSAGRVLRVTRAGLVETLATGLEAPEGIAVVGERIFVNESEKGTITEITRSGNVVVTRLDGGGTPPASPSQPPSMIFNGLAAGDDVLFATDEKQRALYRIDI